MLADEIAADVNRGAYIARSAERAETGDLIKAAYRSDVHETEKLAEKEMSASVSKNTFSEIERSVGTDVTHSAESLAKSTINPRNMVEHTNNYVKLNSKNLQRILENRGLNQEQIKNLRSSFDGSVYARWGNEGETFIVTEGKENTASGLFVTKESAGTTATERINRLALPPSNTALFESKVQLANRQILLEGKVAPQPEWALIANDGIERSGGAWQVVTNGGIYNNAIRRLK